MSVIVITLECHTTCQVNETYRDSGIDCQTCKNYQYVKCALKHESKCYCLDGYVRDEATGFCKSPEDCPI
ncbi:serine protease inhibitor-like superfamily [Holotrichia oblita]|uniref:Serine protease inhibitor-like superfamily n=1 Tax=Holotrichia oblita TaxID=644536 RepID=A0ACB9T9R5_HOLOL|nr:serine protease inhibitor-like superfamily [Holotrichia oblita]